MGQFDTFRAGMDQRSLNPTFDVFSGTPLMEFVPVKSQVKRDHKLSEETLLSTLFCLSCICALT